VNLTRRSLFSLIAALPVWARLGFHKQPSTAPVKLDIFELFERAIDMNLEDQRKFDALLAQGRMSEYSELRAFWDAQDAKLNRWHDDARKLGFDLSGSPSVSGIEEGPGRHMLPRQAEEPVHSFDLNPDVLSFGEMEDQLPPLPPDFERWSSTMQRIPMFDFSADTGQQARAWILYVLNGSNQMTHNQWTKV
jgi:hypothetical protein